MQASSSQTTGEAHGSLHHSLGSLGQRLRLLVITQLWTAYCTARSRPDRQVTPTHIAARVLAAARDRICRSWLLVGSDIRLRAGVLSHWLRGRQPAMTQEQFFFFFFFWVEESLHAHRCQSYQQFERQIKQTTEEFRVHSTSYDKGSCFAMA